MYKKEFIERKQTPTELLRYDLVKLRSEVSNHYSKALGSLKEQFAFAKKTKVFSISLEPYTDKDIIKQVMEHYAELDEMIKGIRKDKTLDTKNKDANIIKLEFEYAEPIFLQSLRIFHNSPLIERSTGGVLDPRDEGIRDRIREIGNESKISEVDGEFMHDEISD